MKKFSLNNLISFRVPFYPNISVGSSIEEAKFIFELSGGSLYLLFEPHYDTEQSFESYMQERLNYYCKELNFDEYNCDFFENHELKFKALYQHKDYLVLLIDDFKTFVFFFTTNNDDYMSIFSSDFEESFLKTYTDEWGEWRYKCKMYEDVLEKHKNYIATKKFIFYDTYPDDEDENYLFKRRGC